MVPSCHMFVSLCEGITQSSIDAHEFLRHILVLVAAVLAGCARRRATSTVPCLYCRLGGGDGAGTVPAHLSLKRCG